MRLKIHGPNLMDQSKGDFVAHAADCKDNDKVKYLFGSDREGRDSAWEIEADTIRQVVEEVYSDFIFANDKDPWTNFTSDIHFAPCCSGLPLTKRGRPKKVAATRKPVEGRKGVGDEPIAVGDLIPFRALDRADFMVQVVGVGKTYVDILIRERVERYHRERLAQVGESMFKEVRA